MELGFLFKSQPPMFLSSLLLLPSPQFPPKVFFRGFSSNVCLMFFSSDLNTPGFGAQFPHAPLFLKVGFSELVLQIALSLGHSGRKGSLDQCMRKTLIPYPFLETQSTHAHNKRSDKSGNKEAWLTQRFLKPISSWNLLPYFIDSETLIFFFLTY